MTEGCLRCEGHDRPDRTWRSVVDAFMHLLYEAHLITQLAEWRVCQWYVAREPYDDTED